MAAVEEPKKGPSRNNSYRFCSCVPGALQHDAFGRHVAVLTRDRTKGMPGPRSTRCRKHDPRARRILTPTTDDQFLAKYLFGSLDFLVQLNVGRGGASLRCLRLLHAVGGRLDLCDTCVRRDGVLSDSVVRIQH